MTRATAQTDAALDGRKAIAARIARDIAEGWHVNLGVGIPTLVADLVPAGREVLFHSENGILGMGPAPAPTAIDPWLINAGKQHVTLVPGASLFDHALSFAMIRGGHIDLCVLGALEVAENGDLANWSTSANDTAPAVGGAMDLAVGAKRVWVAMEHVTKQGGSKLVTACSYPLTAARCVDRIYTNLATINVTPRGFELIELAAGASFDDVQARTDGRLYRAEGV
jgi:3-oxoadipate CoA-transferase beta subunit